MLNMYICTHKHTHFSGGWGGGVEPHYFFQTLSGDCIKNVGRVKLWPSLVVKIVGGGSSFDPFSPSNIEHVNYVMLHKLMNQNKNNRPKFSC